MHLPERLCGWRLNMLWKHHGATQRIKHWTQRKMARKADLFHLAPGYAAMGTDFHVKGNLLSGKISPRHNHSERGGQERQGVSIGIGPPREASFRGKRKGRQLSQGDKELVLRDAAVSRRMLRTGSWGHYRLTGPQKQWDEADVRTRTLLFSLTFWVLQVWSKVGR